MGLLELRGVPASLVNGGSFRFDGIFLDVSFGAKLIAPVHEQELIREEP